MSTKTMKALFSTGYGSVDKLEFREIPVPEPVKNQVRIRIHASSVNSWDWDLVRGKPFYVRLVFPGGLKKPRAIPGCDVAGVVEAVGPEVQRLKEGDEVFGDSSASGWGGFAEYVCIPEDVLALKSPGMSFGEAASLPQAGVLALQGLRDVGKVRKDEVVAFNGGGGGVGTLGIQMAKNMGARVTVIDRAEKQERLLTLGADEFIDFERNDYLQRSYDVILDVVGNRPFRELRNALNPGGRYVMVGGSASLIFQLLFRGKSKKDRSMGILNHQIKKEDLEILGKWVSEGTLKPVIDKHFQFEEIPDAIAYLGSGKIMGKVVVNHR